MSEMPAFKVTSANEDNNFVPKIDAQNTFIYQHKFVDFDAENISFMSMNSQAKLLESAFSNSDVSNNCSNSVNPTFVTDDFEFLKPNGIADFNNVNENSAVSLEVIKEAFQKGQMAGFAAAAATRVPSGNQPTGNSNHFDYSYRMNLPGNTIVQVPSPWIHAIESPIETPLSAFEVHSTDLTPNGTPLIHSTWAASPFMGSPFLSPFDEPKNLNASQNIQPVGDISTWWSENSGFVDSKSFSELLADTGLDLGMDISNDTLIMDGGEVEVENVESKRVKKESPKPSCKRPKNCFQEESMPSGAFWKVIKSENQQTLFQCPFENCFKTFTRPYNLKSHYRSHTGERPYICEFEKCSLKFSRKYDLKRHEKIHSGVKGVECTDCGKTFIRTDYLRRHQKVPEGKLESECQALQKK